MGKPCQLTIKENLRRYHVFSLLEDKAGTFGLALLGRAFIGTMAKRFTNFTERQGFPTIGLDVLRRINQGISGLARMAG